VTDSSKPRYTRYVSDDGLVSGYRSYPDNNRDALPSAFLIVEHHPEKTYQTVIHDGTDSNQNVYPSIDREKFYQHPMFSDTTPWHESGLVDNPTNSNVPARPARKDEQLQLFGYTPARPSVVDTLISRKGLGSRMSAMTLLGMADLHSRERFGTPLKPSDNLSEHSMRIVRHLGHLGAISAADVPDDTQNRLNFYAAETNLNNDVTYGEHTSSHLADDVTHDAPRAKRHISNILRSGKTKTKAEPEKPEQLSMPLEGWDSK